MFESAELGHKIKKSVYEKEMPPLRVALLEAQDELRQRAEFPVIIIVGGLDGSGRGATVNLLNEWMDPRHIETHGMGDPSDEELDRPMMWRFWRSLPPKGKIGVFFGSWYTWPVLNRVGGITKDADLDQSLARARRLEKMLVDEGALLIKLWLHLSKEQVIAPENAQVYVAIGAALGSVNEKPVSFMNLMGQLRNVDESSLAQSDRIEPLFNTAAELKEFQERHSQHTVPYADLAAYSGPCYLGMDAGSTTIKSVLLSEDNKILYTHYQNNEGSPLLAAKKIVEEIYKQLPAGAFIAKFESLLSRAMSNCRQRRNTALFRKPTSWKQKIKR